MTLFLVPGIILDFRVWTSTSIPDAIYSFNENFFVTFQAFNGHLINLTITLKQFNFLNKIKIKWLTSNIQSKTINI